MKSKRPFYLLLLALFILLFIPNLIKKGMFVDGLWYATISNNLADGIGSFWSPCFTRTMYPHFFEHPPLVFGIQSTFFKLFGNSLYVEKIYAFFIICITLTLIIILWRLLFRDSPELRSFAFMPGILWIIHDTTYLYYPNNLLECTQGVFILISVIFIVKGIQEANKRSYLFMFLAGISLIFSFLSKGFTGLYPLIAIIIYYLIFKTIPFKRMVLYNIIFWGGFSLIFLLLVLNKNAATDIINYINTQVIAALEGHRTENMQSSRFHILKMLFETSLLPLTLVVILTLISYFKHGERNIFKYKKEFLFFLILCLSGVIPMMVSKKQGTYYLLTVTPYISIALSLILIRSEKIIYKLNESKLFRNITLVLLISAIIYPFFSINKINKRDRTILHDLKKFDTIIKDNSTMGCITKNNEISLYGYFMRLYTISVDTTRPYNYPLLVSDKETPIDTSNYQSIDLKTEKFNLYRKKQTSSKP